ncbi:MAG: DUF177 domain-containing protein [Chloroflexi bacterium]|nr:DUF177 domain-containing protein [Chloroflexota bacterium]
MQFNVAGLLKGAVGATQRHLLDEAPLSLEDIQAERVWGAVTLMRVNDGVWVRGDFRATVECACSRCLRSYPATVSFHFDETYYPTLDIASGVAITLPDGAEADAAIDNHHILDISEAIRQNIILGLPMKPLCKPACAGICARCGRDMNESPCACPQDTGDPRWAALKDPLSPDKN